MHDTEWRLPCPWASSIFPPSSCRPLRVAGAEEAAGAAETRPSSARSDRRPSAGTRPLLQRSATGSAAGSRVSIAGYYGRDCPSENLHPACVEQRGRFHMQMRPERRKKDPAVNAEGASLANQLHPRNRSQGFRRRTNSEPRRHVGGPLTDS